MYSCGSLTRKMKRGGGGCMDHQFHKPAQPWEKSEGYTAHKHTHTHTYKYTSVCFSFSRTPTCVCVYVYIIILLLISSSLILLQVYSPCIRTQSIKTMS